MGCAGSAPDRLCEAVPRCENPLVDDQCVGKSETIVGLDRCAVDLKRGQAGSTMLMTELNADALQSAGNTLCSMSVRPAIQRPDANTAAEAKNPAIERMLRASALCASDGTVVGAVKTEQSDLPKFKDERSMVFYSTLALFEGQAAVSITLDLPEGTKTYSMYPRFRQVAEAYSSGYDAIYLATPSGFAAERSYRIVLKASKGSPFFVTNVDLQKVAIAKWQGSVYHVQVAQNMDASLVAVAYLVAELLKEECPEAKGALAGSGGGGGA